MTIQDTLTKNVHAASIDTNFRYYNRVKERNYVGII